MTANQPKTDDPTELRVKVTVYQDLLCIETVQPVDDDKNFVPAGNGRIGCVIMDTEGRLGLSEEALEWLRKVSKSGDDIGDVDAWIAGNGKGVFSWLGGMFCIKPLNGISGSSTYDIDAIPHVTIPNDVPEGAKASIDSGMEAV